MGLLGTRQINHALVNSGVAEDFLKAMFETRGAVAQNGLSNDVFEEGAGFFIDLIAHVLVEVFSGEAWATNDDAADLRIGRLAIERKVLDKRVYDLIEELGLAHVRLLGLHGATRLRDSLVNLGLQNRLVVADDEDVSDALLHGHGDDTAHFLLLLDLIETPNVHGVENGLDDLNLSRWEDIHCLLLVQGDVPILFSVDSIDPERVVLSVILEGLDFQGCSKGLVLDFGQALGRGSFKLDLTMARSCDQVVDRQQVVDVPDIVRLGIEVHPDCEDFLLVVDYFLDNFHFASC